MRKNKNKKTMHKNAPPVWSNPHLIHRAPLFWWSHWSLFVAACRISAGWKSERSSSNRSEVACADRRVGRLQWIKAWKMLRKGIFTFFHTCFTFQNTFFTFLKMHMLNTFFHIFNSIYYNPSVTELAISNVAVLGITLRKLCSTK